MAITSKVQPTEMNRKFLKSEKITGLLQDTCKRIGLQMNLFPFSGL